MKAGNRSSGPRNGAGPLACEVIRSRAELARLGPEWLELYVASGSTNPFAHPAWVTTWLEHYTPADDLYVLAVRNAGRLVGLAPFYRRRVAGGKGLQLAGVGTRDRLTEIPEIVVGGHPGRKVLRRLVGFLLAEADSDWDWVKLTLGPRLGWFESDWAENGHDHDAWFVHTSSAAFVILELPPRWDDFRAGLKRNVNEAVRRSANRLAKVESWEYAVPETTAELEAAFDSLARLHGLRSDVNGRERHPNYLANPRDADFLRRAAVAMFEAGAATIPRLQIEGEDAAARLVLNVGQRLFLSVSGLHPRYWDYGPGTMLMLETLRRAALRGVTSANLSMDPDESKLRWSERLEFHHRFLLVSPRRRSRLAGALHLLLRSGNQGYSLLREQR